MAEIGTIVALFTVELIEIMHLTHQRLPPLREIGMAEVTFG